MSDIAQHPLQHYQNARVQIYYNNANGYQDTGTLLYRDNHWVELQKDDGWHLLIPIVAIRIIKLLEKVDPHADAQILLRAAADTPHKQITGDK